MRKISFQYSFKQGKCEIPFQPEVILLDATYKLNDHHMPLYVMIVIDGNGESEIVGLWLVENEERKTLSFALDAFKKHNPQWERIECVMTDKDITERDVIYDKLPGKQLLICLFHTLRTFRREVTQDKLGISQGERLQALETLQKLAYSQSGDEYGQWLEQLRLTTPATVVDYFMKNWHPIRSQWVEGMKTSHVNFFTSTNNRLESINHKLKAVIERYSPLPVFFSDLMKCIWSLQSERKYRATNLIVTVPTVVPANESIKEYQKALTPFAYNYVKKQFDLMKRVKIDMNQSDLSTGQFVITASAGEFISTTEDCPCGFFKAMMLPCKHILAVRDILKCPLFSETLCATRWLLQHYIQNHAFIESSGSNTLDITVDSDFPSVEAATLSEQEKYRKAFKVAQETATDLSLLGTADFNVYYKQLKSVRDLIRKRHPFLVIPAEKSEQLSSKNILK
eukprot:m.287597 g.287597  ORF g.287597 m.287597 type:complete len:453 (+) comp40703_c0_seq36:596-1954(+)